jgi:hypothetical protein
MEQVSLRAERGQESETTSAGARRLRGTSGFNSSTGSHRRTSRVLAFDPVRRTPGTIRARVGRHGSTKPAGRARGRKLDMAGLGRRARGRCRVDAALGQESGLGLVQARRAPARDDAVPGIDVHRDRPGPPQLGLAVPIRDDRSVGRSVSIDCPPSMVWRPDQSTPQSDRPISVAPAGRSQMQSAPLQRRPSSPALHLRL